MTISPPGALLSAEIWVDYPERKGVLQGACIDVFPGEIVGLVGQSGSGKSTLALAILRLLDRAGATVTGRIHLLSQDLTGCNERQLRDIRGRLVSLIPQSPAAALNPALRIGTQLREAWRAHSSEPWSGQEEFISELLAIAGLSPREVFLKSAQAAISRHQKKEGLRRTWARIARPPCAEFLESFPGQISVGQAQRVLIIMALLHSPPLLIADEPTSALDVITQREILDLLIRIRKENKMSMLFISHDLLTVAAICDRLAILHLGKVVECGPTKSLLADPQHPYTKQLIAAAPKWA